MTVQKRLLRLKQNSQQGYKKNCIQFPVSAVFRVKAPLLEHTSISMLITKV